MCKHYTGVWFVQYYIVYKARCTCAERQEPPLSKSGDRAGLFLWARGGRIILWALNFYTARVLTVCVRQGECKKCII